MFFFCCYLGAFVVIIFYGIFAPWAARVYFTFSFLHIFFVWSSAPSYFFCLLRVWSIFLFICIILFVVLLLVGECVCVWFCLFFGISCCCCCFYYIVCVFVIVSNCLLFVFLYFHTLTNSLSLLEKKLYSISHLSLVY